jgi:hypothetical protein
LLNLRREAEVTAGYCRSGLRVSNALQGAHSQPQPNPRPRSNALQPRPAPRNNQ